MEETPKPSAAATAPAAPPSGAAPAAAASAPAAPAAAPAAKPAAAKPSPAKPDAASPQAPRPSVVFSGLAALAVEDVVAPFSYTVQPGDTLSGLARDFYGDRSKATFLREANQAVLAGASEPAPGTRIKIPKR